MATKRKRIGPKKRVAPVEVAEKPAIPEKLLHAIEMLRVERERRQTVLFAIADVLPRRMARMIESLFDDSKESWEFVDKALGIVESPIGQPDRTITWNITCDWQDITTETSKAREGGK